MKMALITLKNQAINRFLIVVLHIVGWTTYLSLPFFFLGQRLERRMPGSGPGSGPEDFRIPRTGDWGPPPGGTIDFATIRLQSLLFNIVLIGFFYFNMYVLIPRVLTRKSWIHYLLSIVLCLGFIAVCNELINLVIFPAAHQMGKPFYFTMVNFLLVFGLSTALRLTSDRVRFDRERKERETENLKSELSLLRSQVSPHFMFNVLNNLASLARKKSDQLESVIVQLSHLMRYMLYDSGEKKVTVEKEIQYLASYIDLQELRFGKDVKVSFDTDVVDSDLPIEPMLLIPFVENAFKHGVGMITDPAIAVKLSISDHTLNFIVKNKFNDRLGDTKDPGSGIGIQNVQRRLELLYKDLHHLKIHTEDDWFIAELKLILR